MPASIRPTARAACIPLVAGLITVAGAASTHAQDAPAPSSPIAVDLSIGGQASFHSTREDSGPYLYNALGGTVPGARIGVDIASKRVVRTLETSASTKLSVLQRGRLVDGDGRGSKLATHRDVLVSVLPGVRANWSRAQLDVKGGMTLVLSNPHRDGESSSREDPRGDVAVTAGIDLALPIGARTRLTPNIRYDRVLGGTPYLFELSPHVVRVGVSLRFQLSR